MTTIKTLTATAACTLAAFALPFSAAQAAGPKSEPRAVTIAYDDLNLSSQKGKDILDRRIEAALVQVCGEMQNRPTFDSAVRKCQTETRVTAQRSRDLAIAQYNNPRLARSEKPTIRLVVR